MIIASYKLTIPLDASGIPDFKPDQAVRVTAEDAKGKISEQVVKLDAKAAQSSAAPQVLTGEPFALRRRLPITLTPAMALTH